MAPSIGFLAAIEFPFPGLRAFETEESLLFFGRETHTEELLRRLSESRFLAVVGTSGCGKSSLVRAGLLPALFRGYLVGATSRWRVAVLRPGTAPIDALAATLAKDGVLGPQDATKLRETLGATSGGLAEAVQQAHLAPGESLLVVVDQFEEIFRFAPESQGGVESQVSLFVSLLLHAAESDAPIYVTLTMRSDFQGDCAQFPGLTEALNRSQYLVSRLTRDQRREAIVRPLDLVDATLTPRLLNRLLNDAGDDPDQLPVLQHALLRTYRRWREAGGRGAIDLPDYEAIGGIAYALGRHGDEILAGLKDDELGEKIFRCLTTTERGRVIRRPKELGALHAVVNAADEPAQAAVNAVLSAFARRESSLLMLSSPALEPGTVVDITHESLVRKWPRLAAWVKEEARSAEWYSDLARDVGRHHTGDAGLWRDPALSEVLERRDREGWNEAWALQCSRPDDPRFAEVETFLDASIKAQEKERSLQEAQKWKDLAHAQTLARIHRHASIWLLLLLIATVAIFVVYLLYRQKQRAVEDLQQRELFARRAYSAEQQEAIQLRARYDEVNRQLSTADPDEKAKLRQELAGLKNSYTASESKVNDYQVELDTIRKNQDLAAADHGALLKRIQDLQGQLNAMTAERDKLQLQLNQASAEKSINLKNIADLQSQLATVTTERDKLVGERTKLRGRLASAERPVAPPIFKAVQQFSVVHLTTAPFADKVAIGVGDVHVEDSSYLRIYLWTTDGNAPLPETFHGDKKLSSRLLAPLDRLSCKAEGAGGISCYRVQKLATISGTQQAGTFDFGGNQYEILATGWHNNVAGGKKDSISLAIYPATQGAPAK